MINKIIIVAGRSGSGKSTLAKAMAKRLKCEMIGFSYAGRKLSIIEKESEEYIEIEDYIYQCILSALKRSERIIIDGLASERIFKLLQQDGYNTYVFFLDTPMKERVQRIAIREACTFGEAKKIEEIKAIGKLKAGLEFVIGKAIVKIDGRFNAEETLEQALDFYHKAIEEK